MLKGLTVENFKAFKERQEIPLAPITLIYGRNSAGKSTVIQALRTFARNMHMQSDSLRSADHSRSRSANPQIAYRTPHMSGEGESRTLEIGVETILNSSFRLEAEIRNKQAVLARMTVDLESDRNISIFPFTRRPPYKSQDEPSHRDFGVLTSGMLEDYRGDEYSTSKLLHNLLSNPEWTTQFQNALPVQLLEMDRADLERLKQKAQREPFDLEFYLDIQTTTNLFDVRIDSTSLTAKNLTTLFFIQMLNKMNELKLVVELGKLASDTRLRAAALSDPNAYWDELSTRIRKDLYNKRVEGDRAGFRDIVTWIDWGDPATPDYFARRQSDDGIESILGDVPVFGPLSLELVHDCMDELTDVRFLNTLQRHYKIVSAVLNKKSSHVPPVRKPLSGTFQNLQPGKDLTRNQVSDQDQIITELRNNHQLMTLVNKTFAEMGIHYRITPAYVPNPGGLELVDTLINQTVQFDEVGSGISQVIPVIVECFRLQHGIVLIEQPELHLHPAQQAALGSLFAGSYRELDNQFIIETHSEELVLRLQRLIREGKLTNDDVKVLYVDRDENGSHCFELRLDKDGEFIDPWPGGFFEENIRERFPRLVK